MSTNVIDLPIPRRFSITLVLWLGGACGLCGLHRMYLGRWRSGLVYLCTFGLCGVGQVFDWFRLGAMVRATATAGTVGGGTAVDRRSVAAGH